MKRILLMVLRNFYAVPYLWYKLCSYAKHTKEVPDDEKYRLLKRITSRAVKGGRIKIETYGAENIPENETFMMFPNHQGMFDVLAIVESCPYFFSVVLKKEVKDVQFLKQVIAIMGAKAMDREDVRQSMKIIMEVTEEVKNGKNYVIFAEGTRSREGNKLLDFKGGSFKAAMKAKCPIVPVALIDSYKCFDINSIRPVTVQVHYLEAITYEEYKNLKTTEVAVMVKERIQKVIEKYKKND